MLTIFRLVFAPPRDLILLGVAGWIGLALADNRAGRSGFDARVLDNLAFALTAAFLIGGRFFYAAEHLSVFVQSTLSLISPNTALFDNWGGLTVAGITGFVFGQRNKLALWPTLDALTPLLATLAVGLGFSHLASGAAFGKETDLPWAWQLWGANRHPTQVYEIIAALLILGFTWFRKRKLKPGGDFLSFVVLTSGSRLIIEAFRGDSTLVLGGLRVAQVSAWIILALSLLGLERVVFPTDIPSPETKRKSNIQK